MSSPSLIIGASGFIGRHLALELQARGSEVAGTYFNSGNAVGDAVYQLDIFDRVQVQKVVREVQPGVVFHLGAGSVPSHSWVNPIECYRVNLEGAVLVSEACLDLPDSPLLVFPSTAHVYGANPPQGRGLRETDPCQPHSPYGVSKWAAERHLAAMSQRLGLRTVIFRLFNQFGPGQKGPFFVSEMAEAIVQLEREHPPHAVIRTGNLNLYRDFLDVRDAVKALALAADPEYQPVMTGKTYNLGRGQGVYLANIVQTLLDAAMLPITPETDPQKLRPNEAPSLYADTSLLQSETGWRPERPLEASLKEVLEEARAREEDTERNPKSKTDSRKTGMRAE